MKKLMFVMLVACLMVACGTIQIKTENVFTITTEAGDKFTCSNTNVIDENTAIIDLKCVGFLDKDGNTYRCEIDLTTDNKPITEKIVIDQYCKIEIKKE